MAHFAEIDSDNIVTRVLVVPENQQHRGQDYLSIDLMLGGRWIQTSYNNNFRRSFAAQGYIYNELLDIFIPPKPFPSWTLNIETGVWESPIPKPDGATDFEVDIWDEINQKWNREILPIPTQ
jgi:hypothetical protein